MGTDTYSLDLSPHPGAARAARLAVEHCLRRWCLSAALDDACLIVSELVANSARLGSVFSLALTRKPAGLLIEVRDRSSEPPVLQAPGLDSETGRGLLLVEAYATAWGWRPEATGGKTTWARLG